MFSGCAGPFRRAVYGLMAVLLLAACGQSGAAPIPQPIALATDLAPTFSSWSWNILSGTSSSDPLIVGISRHKDGLPTLSVSQFHADGHLEQLADIPAFDGSLHSVKALRHSSGASLVATVVDQSGKPHIEVLYAEDERSWRRLAPSKELALVPDIIATDGGDIIVGRDRQLWRISLDGSVTDLAAPPLTAEEIPIQLAGRNSRLWLLTSTPGSDAPQLWISSDNGVSWEQQPVGIHAATVSRFEASGMLERDGQLLFTGRCGPDNGGGPCVIIGTPEAGWETEHPFGTTTIPIHLLPAASGADRNLLAVATITGYSEVWLTERPSSGPWQSSRASLLSATIGEARAVGAGPGGRGFLVVLNDFQTTRLVLRSHPGSAPVNDRVFALGGPEQGPWLDTVGSAWGERSQLLLSHRELQKVGTGSAYRSIKKSVPVSVEGATATTAEWRPAAARGLDFILSEPRGSRSVLAGSRPVSGNDLGGVRVFTAAQGGPWNEVATELEYRLDGQLATALAANDRGWLLATGDPTRSQAVDPARIFQSEDGIAWREEPGPTQTTGEASSIDVFCPSPSGRLVALGTRGQAATPIAWIRDQDSSWSTPAIADEDRLRGCATFDGTIVAISNRKIWRQEGDGFTMIQTNLPHDSRPSAIVAVPDGLATLGTYKRDGLTTTSVWFSRDAEKWQEVRLGAMPGPTKLEILTRADGVLIGASSRSGMEIWEVATPW